MHRENLSLCWNQTEAWSLYVHMRHSDMDSDPDGTTERQSPLSNRLSDNQQQGTMCAHLITKAPLREQLICWYPTNGLTWLKHCLTVWSAGVQARQDTEWHRFTCIESFSCKAILFFIMSLSLKCIHSLLHCLCWHFATIHLGSPEKRRNITSIPFACERVHVQKSHRDCSAAHLRLISLNKIKCWMCYERCICNNDCWQ